MSTQPNRSNSQPRSSWTFKALVLTLAVAVAGSTLALARRGGDYTFFDPLIDIKAIVDTYGFEPPDEGDLQAAAIAGMLEALDDPYAQYVPASETDDFEKALIGEYVGIGAEVNVRGGFLHIVTPLDGSPALQAGLMAGDLVLEIDGETTEGRTVEESIQRLKGDEGTEVALLVERDGGTQTITVVRAQINLPIVRGFHRLDDDDASWQYLLDPDLGIAYIRLASFTPTSAQAVRDAIAQAERQAADAGRDGGLGGLILDLRSNPGGLLDQAVAIADMFLAEGVIVSTRGRPTIHPERISRARSQASDHGVPLLLLINGQSASASEVLSGALTENGRAVALGTRTFGKGSVQSIHPLTGSAAGGQLKLTEQRYYLPTGRSIQRTDDSAQWGVDPTDGFFVPMTDEQFLDMLRVRREQEIIGGPVGEGSADDGGFWSDPELIVERLKDPQLAAGVDALTRRINTGDWVAVGEPANEVDPALLEEIRTLQDARDRLDKELNRLDRRLETLELAASGMADPELDSDAEAGSEPDQSDETEQPEL